jgi:hypothetical protein
MCGDETPADGIFSFVFFTLVTGSMKVLEPEIE